MKKSTFIYLAPHIVGNAENYGYCYDTDWEEKTTRLSAQKHGEKVLEHDDFWVAELRDRKVIALYSGDEKREDQEEVDDVNKGLALT
jgi:hypothetical protein